MVFLFLVCEAPMNQKTTLISLPYNNQSTSRINTKCQVYVFLLLRTTEMSTGQIVYTFVRTQIVWYRAKNIPRHSRKIYYKFTPWSINFYQFLLNIKSTLSLFNCTSKSNLHFRCLCEHFQEIDIKSMFLFNSKVCVYMLKSL